MTAKSRLRKLAHKRKNKRNDESRRNASNAAQRSGEAARTAGEIRGVPRNLGCHGPWTPEQQVQEDRSLDFFNGWEGFKEQEYLRQLSTIPGILAREGAWFPSTEDALHQEAAFDESAISE